MLPLLLHAAIVCDWQDIAAHCLNQCRLRYSTTEFAKEVQDCAKLIALRGSNAMLAILNTFGYDRFAVNCRRTLVLESRIRTCEISNGALALAMAVQATNLSIIVGMCETGVAMTEAAHICAKVNQQQTKERRREAQIFYLVLLLFLSVCFCPNSLTFVCGDNN